MSKRAANNNTNDPAARVGRFRMRELYRLYRHRHGDEPRKADLQAMILEATRGRDPCGLSQATCGEAVELTLDERKALRITTILPFDCSFAAMKASYAEDRKQRDRQRKQAKRQREKPMTTTSKDRAAMVLDVLREHAQAAPLHWLTVDDLAEAVGRRKPFRGPCGEITRADGTPLEKT